jgi:hypothetical protein
MFGGHELREGLSMSEPAEVSLETDRLEQLLEVPAPVQPVVMIEYRSRGVPWWVQVPLVVMLPVLAVLYYRHALLEKYRERVSNDAYLMQKSALEKAAVLAPAPAVATAEPAPADVAQGPAPVAIVAEAASAPSAKPTGAAPPVPERVLPQVGPTGASETLVTDSGEQAKGRVRSIFPSPFDSVDTAEGLQESGGDSTGRPSGPPGRPIPDDTPNTKVAKAEEPSRVGDVSGPPEGAATKPGSAERSPAGKAAGDRRKPVTAVEPLPSNEEFVDQLTQEAAQKNAEIVEEQEALAERTRTRQHEDRVRFHEELNQILTSQSTKMGLEIDDLVKRERGDLDPKLYGKARGIWRQPRLTMAQRANQIRELDVPESDILNFISDNLYANMHTRGGPRDGNEVRVRAAKLLLKCPIPDASDARAPVSVPSSVQKPRGTGESRPR